MRADAIRPAVMRPDMAKPICPDRDIQPTMQGRPDTKDLRVPVRDRILLHLMDYGQFRETLEVPFEMSQSGIASALGVDRSQVTKALKELKRRDLVEERVTYATGAARRCKVYSPAMPGEVYADKLKVILLAHQADLPGPAGQRISVQLSLVWGPVQDTVRFSRLICALLADKVTLVEGTDGSGWHPVIEGFPEPVGPVTAQRGPIEIPEAPGPDTVEPATYPYVLGSPFYDIGQGRPKAPWTPAVPSDGTTVSGTVSSAEHGYLTGTYERTPPMAVSREHPEPPPAADPAQPEKVLPPADRGKMKILLVGSAIIYFPLVLFGLIFVNAVYLGSGVCCTTVFPLFLGLIIVVTWAFGHSSNMLLRLLPNARIMVIVLAFIGIALFLWMLSQALGPRLDADGYLAIVLVSLPLYLLVAAVGRIPAHIRGEFGIAAGAFLMLASATLRFDPAFFGQNPALTTILVVMGAGLLLVGREVGNLWGAETLRAASPGLGAALVALPLTVAYLSWPPDAFTALAEGALVLFGAFLVVIPVLGAPTASRIYRILARSLLLCAGAALLVLGISLTANRVYLGALEVLLALPVLYYGYTQFGLVLKEDTRLAAAVLALALATEIISLSRLLWFF